VEMFWGESTWSTAPSAVFPCGGRRRGTVSPGSRTARRSVGLRACVCAVPVCVVSGVRVADAPTGSLTPRTRCFRPPPNPLPQPRGFRAPGVVSREGVARDAMGRADTVSLPETMRSRTPSVRRSHSGGRSRAPNRALAPRRGCLNARFNGSTWIGKKENGSRTVERGLCAGTRVGRANVDSPASKTADGAVL
jgi:hypothetical protein